MDKFNEIIKKHYNNEMLNDHNVKYDRSIENIIFNGIIKNEINNGKIKKDQFKSFDIFVKYIVCDQKYYQIIKKICINELIPQDKVVDIFILLEEHGLKSFVAINNMELKSIVPKIKFKNRYNNIKDKLINFSSDCCLNLGILAMLEYFNSCMFMPRDVFNDINPNITKLDVYNFGNASYLHQCFVLSDKGKTVDLIELSRMATVAQKSICEMFGIELDYKSDVVFYCSNAKKLFPKIPGCVVNETNVNSGDTMIFGIIKNPTIRMYRLEEIIKVLIHEVCHTTQVEGNYNRNPDHNFKIFNTRSQSNDLLFSETIVEVIAEFINCVIVGERMNKNRLMDEVKFGIMQSSKILNYFGFLSIDDFLSDSKDVRIIKQSTAMFEYHVLKTVLLYKFDDFIKYLRGKKGDISEALIKMIVEVLKHDEKYRIMFDESMKGIVLLSDKDKMTFRMSIVEFNGMSGGGINYMRYYEEYKMMYKLLKNH